MNLIRFNWIKSDLFSFSHMLLNGGWLFLRFGVVGRLDCSMRQIFSVWFFVLISFRLMTSPLFQQWVHWPRILNRELENNSFDGFLAIEKHQKHSDRIKKNRFYCFNWARFGLCARVKYSRTLLWKGIFTCKFMLIGIVTVNGVTCEREWLCGWWWTTETHACMHNILMYYMCGWRLRRHRRRRETRGNNKTLTTSQSFSIYTFIKLCKLNND